MEQIEQLAIETLTPYKNNARVHSPEQIKQIANSIKEFGFNVPVLIDKDNTIISGHGRVEAARRINLKTIPTIKIEHLTEEQKKAYIIADNQIALNSEWDISLLSSELKELDDKIDLSNLGFDQKELTELLKPDDVDGLTDEDELPPVPDEPNTKLGQLFQLGNHRLMCGDSTVKDDVERLMGEDKAQMVFTDPPWNVDYGSNLANGKYKNRKILNDAMSTDDFKDFMSKVFLQMKNVCEPGCMTYVVMSAQEWGNAMLTLALNDFHWSSTIIWNKDTLVISRKDYHTKYEPIWYGWLKGESRLKVLKDRKQSDVWDIKRPKRSEMHPTTKPIELISRAVNNSSGVNDIVLDLFGGSGSTLIACEKNHRDARIMELDPKYCDVIIKRWENYTGKTAKLLD
jgi:DNA modification methylase